MNRRILTIYEVRANIKEVDNILEIVNCHILDNSVDTYDYDNLRKAYQLLRDTFIANWTNQLL